jgi:hypothetical protein
LYISDSNLPSWILSKNSVNVPPNKIIQDS